MSQQRQPVPRGTSSQAEKLDNDSLFVLGHFQAFQEVLQRRQLQRAAFLVRYCFWLHATQV